MLLGCIADDLTGATDLAVSGWFYDAQRGFAANDSALVRGIYDAVLWGSRGLLTHIFAFPVALSAVLLLLLSGV